MAGPQASFERGAAAQTAPANVTCAWYDRPMPTLESVIEQVMQLSPDDRDQVARCIAEAWGDGRDPAVQRAWEVEIERRLARLRSGDSQLVSFDTFVADASARLSR